MRQREAERLMAGPKCRTRPTLPFLGRALPLARHFRAGAARFGQPDGNGLFSAGDFLAGSAAAQRSALALAHDLLDLLGCLLAVFATATFLRHQSPPVRYLATLSRLWFLQTAADREQDEDAQRQSRQSAG